MGDRAGKSDTGVMVDRKEKSSLLNIVLVDRRNICLDIKLRGFLQIYAHMHEIVSIKHFTKTLLIVKYKCKSRSSHLFTLYENYGLRML